MKEAGGQQHRRSGGGGQQHDMHDMHSDILEEMIEGEDAVAAVAAVKGDPMDEGQNDAVAAAVPNVGGVPMQGVPYPKVQASPPVKYTTAVRSTVTEVVRAAIASTGANPPGVSTRKLVIRGAEGEEFTSKGVSFSLSCAPWTFNHLWKLDDAEVKALGTVGSHGAAWKATSLANQKKFTNIPQANGTNHHIVLRCVSVNDKGDVGPSTAGSLKALWERSPADHFFILVTEREDQLLQSMLDFHKHGKYVSENLLRSDSNRWMGEFATDPCHPPIASKLAWMQECPAWERLQMQEEYDRGLERGAAADLESVKVSLCVVLPLVSELCSVPPPACTAIHFPPRAAHAHSVPPACTAIHFSPHGAHAHTPSRVSGSCGVCFAL